MEDKKEKLEAQVQKMPYSTDIGILVFNQTSVAESLVMRDCPPNEEINGPTFRLPHDAAQAIMDGLWLCGIRPQDQADFQGSLKATEKHLADMRTLVFKDDVRIDGEVKINII